MSDDCGGACIVLVSVFVPILFGFMVAAAYCKKIAKKSCEAQFQLEASKPAARVFCPAAPPAQNPTVIFSAQNITITSTQPSDADQPHITINVSNDPMISNIQPSYPPPPPYNPNI